MKQFYVLLAFLSLISVVFGTPVTVATSGGGLKLSGVFVGQEFTTLSTGYSSFYDIDIGLRNQGSTTTYYSWPGTAYILTQPYTGTPSGLSNTVPGFLYSTTSQDSQEWEFPTATLLPGVTYYFYVTTVIPASPPNPGFNQYIEYTAAGGGTYYTASSGTSNFAPSSGSLNFRVASQDPVAVTTGAPVTTTTTTQAPGTTTEAPVTTTPAPVTTTQAPVTTTEAPVTTTQAPVTTTQAPGTAAPCGVCYGAWTCAGCVAAGGTIQLNYVASTTCTGVPHIYPGQVTDTVIVASSINNTFYSVSCTDPAVSCTETDIYDLSAPGTCLNSLNNNRTVRTDGVTYYTCDSSSSFCGYTSAEPSTYYVDIQSCSGCNCCATTADNCDVAIVGPSNVGPYTSKRRDVNIDAERRRALIDLSIAYPGVLADSVLEAL